MSEAQYWYLGSKPRAWQLVALDAWRAADCHGVASVVTGGGKTIFAAFCIEQFRQRYPVGRIVIVVPTTALLDQWYVSLTEDLHVPEREIASYSADGIPDAPRSVNLMVLNTARNAAPLCAAFQNGVFLVVDECHRAATVENSKALRGTWTATLGLSATPVREYDSGFEEYIVPTLGPVIYEYDYVMAFRDHVIVPFRLVNVRVPMLFDEEERYNDLTRRLVRAMKAASRNASHADFKIILRQRAAVSANAKMRLPAAIRLLDNNAAERTLVFHERISAAEEICEALNSRGHNATIYHSRLAPALRRDNLRLYRKGMFNVLVSCRALDEGVNIPETTLAIIASSTASGRQRIQRLGRVLRPAPGKSCATIYTLYATDVEERRLQKEAVGLEDITTIDWQSMRLPLHG